jgi:E3 ubiquitin-protein ligase SHPRH
MGNYAKLTVTDSLAQSIGSFIESQSLQNDERPNKRRKLEQDTTDDPNEIAETPARNENVVLCRITIDLVSCLYRKLPHRRISF